jgi:type II restriction enzyme
MPPKLLKELGDINKKESGRIEAYIYSALRDRLENVYEVKGYIKKATPETFSLKKLVSLFESNPGLKRSVDKMYEILVYALFTAIVRALKVRVALKIGNPDKEMLKDFDSFIETVLGFMPESTEVVMTAALFRAGVANAADRGLDMWTNFGAAIQVKHIVLTPDILEDISDDISADRIVIVCLTSEKRAIEAVLKQVGWGSKIQGIVTIDDLDKWYRVCLSEKYKASLGAYLLRDVEREFEGEFPSSTEIEPFIKERGYDKLLTSKK